MEIAFTLQWWVIPTVITICGLVWAATLDDGGGMPDRLKTFGLFSGLGNLLALVPASVVSAIAWIIAAVLK